MEKDNKEQAPFHSHATQYGNKGREKVKEVKKAWGSEFIIINRRYCAKVMTINPKTQVSLHFHHRKTETFILVAGQLTVETVALNTGKTTKTHLVNVGDSITLECWTPHTFYTPDDQLGPTVFVEASTEDDVGDSYRLYPSRGEDANSGGSNNR
jgi:mannose-6-phosphate isomerase-like protein (cupin superfamily)